MARPEIIKYATVLNRAHNEFTNLYIHTQLLQIPSPDNGEVAVVKAVVGGWRGDVQYGPFEGHGDASPNEPKAGTPSREAPIRQAETRAKARALKDLVNIDGTLAEDVSDRYQEDEPSTSSRSETGGRRGSEGSDRRPTLVEEELPSQRPDESNEPEVMANEAQIKAINKLAEDVGGGSSTAILEWIEKEYKNPPEMLTESEAGNLIQRLQQRRAAGRNQGKG